jgi:hypothetical protein
MIITSLMVLPGVGKGCPEWTEKYVASCGILDGQLFETKFAMKGTSFALMPPGRPSPTYLAGW